ncbi:MAG: MBL fold metallo-hydrolase [Mycoplasmataceae bacterium]|nr:MBL fold metallo-hydrolase [Mycoplasmataceae bacterium]
MSKIRSINNIIIFTSHLLKMNTYLIIDKKDCVCIDPGMNSKNVIKYLEDNQLNLIGIVLTHAHFDHIGKAFNMAKEHNLLVYAHADELSVLSNKWNAFMLGVQNKIQLNLVKAFNEDKLLFGNIELGIIKTPGHTPGGVCYTYKDNVFVGDTLFVDSIGRTDLPGGDMQTLMQSLALLKQTINPQYRIFPGHGENDLFVNILKINPYLQK